MDNPEWLVDFNKIKNNNTWIMQLLASQNTNLTVLADKDIALDDIDRFIDANSFYVNSKTEANIKSKMSLDSLDLVGSLIALRSKFNEDISYANEVISKLDISLFKSFLKGATMEDNNFVFKNFPINVTKVINLIKKSVSGIVDFKTLNKKNEHKLLQSTLCSIIWSKVDYTKHAIGTPIDLATLAFDILGDKKDFSFLSSILGSYISDANIKEILYNDSDFYIPYWSKKDDMVTRCKISSLENLSKFLNEVIADYESYKPSGACESLVLIIYNLIFMIIRKLKRIYNKLNMKLVYKNSNTNKNSVIKGAIKASIVSLEELLNYQIKKHFDLTADIKLMTNLELEPKDISVSNKFNKNMFRIVGGVSSIKNKGACDKSVYPIKVKELEEKKSIDIEPSVKGLSNVLLGNKDISIGGLVMDKNIPILTFEAIDKYLENVIGAKKRGIMKIDTYFNKLIKGIKIQKAKRMATELESYYRRIYSETDKNLRKAVGDNVIVSIGKEYKKLKEDEYKKYKDYNEIAKTLKNEHKEENQHKVLELSKLQRKFVIEYFSHKNTAIVYRLLAINILKALKTTINMKTQVDLISSDLISKLEKKFDNIDKEYKMNNYQINPANHQVGGYNPLNHLLQDNPPHEINYILYNNYWKNLEYVKLANKNIYFPMSRNYIDIFYGPIEGEYNKKENYTLTHTMRNLDKIKKYGLILVSNQKDEIEDINKWRILKDEFIKDIQEGSLHNMRHKIYNLIASQSDYYKNTNEWQVTSSRNLLHKVCSFYGKSMLDCQLIISRTELADYLNITNPAK